MQLLCVCHHAAAPSLAAAKKALTNTTATLERKGKNDSAFKKLLLVMNFIALLLLACCLQVAARSFSQSITYSGRNVSMEKVFSVIEEQTGFYVAWNYSILKELRPVTISARDVPLKRFVQHALAGQSLTFVIKGKTIFISSGLSPTAKKVQPESTHSNLLPLPIPVKGRVVNSNGEPMEGVTVSVKNSSVATATNGNGEFILNEVDTDATLVISGISIATQEIKVSREPMHITVQTVINSLEEAVVIGYGTQKRISLTGSVASARGTDIRRSPATNLSNNLVGRLPGLTGVTRSGEPGRDGSVLRIRGNNTLGDNSPLIVVDGIANRGLERINPADIENITILKDASAAIYGAQAANGVILVTTRRGKSGKPRISVNLNAGMTQPTRIPDMADAAQYASILNEMAYYAAPSQGRYQKYSEEDIQKYADGSDPWGHPNTDWFREVFKPWSFQSYQNVTLSGGTENLKYFLSLGARDQDGYYRNSSTRYKQYDFRSNIDAKVSKHISVALDLAGTQENRFGPIRGSGPVFRSLLRGHPIAPARWPDGSPGPDFQEFGEQPVVTSTAIPGYDNSRNYNLLTNMRVNVVIPWIDGLSVQANASFDKTFNFSKKFEKPWVLYNWDGNADHKLTPTVTGLITPQLTQGSTEGQRSTLNLYATYERTFGDHNVKIMAGTERQKGTTDILSAFRKNFISAELDQMFAGATDQFMTNNGSGARNARLNYFGRVNYDYKQRYLLEFVWRYDGSYMFAQGSQFGFFPGISAGWRISEEKFWEPGSFIDDLKLRASWGQTGNDRIEEFQYLSSFGFVDNSWYVYNVSDVYKMLQELRVPNPEVTWEVANQTNLGFDIQLLNHKLSIEFDYFNNLRSNILHIRNQAVPASVGYILPRQNIGKVSNRGFETTISYQGKSGDFRYNFSLNGGYSKNKIVFWDETPGVPDYQQSTGRPIGSNLYYRSIGIFKNKAELEAYPHWVGAMPGDVIFEDINKDGMINGLDMVRNERNDMPRFTGGMSVNLEYRQFDAAILIQGAAGAQHYIRTESGVGGNYYKEFADHRWTPEKTLTDYARAWDFQTEYWATQSNTYWLRSTDYLRLKNIEVGYTVPAKAFRSLRIDNLRFFVNGLNLFTVDKIKLIDPEVGGGQTYPLQRIVNGGLTLLF